MQIAWKFLVTEWWKVVVPLGVFTSCLVAGFIFRRILFRWARRWQFSDVIIHTLRTPIVIWAVMLGIDLATQSSTLPAHYVSPIRNILQGLWIASITIIAAQLFGNMVHSQSSRVQGGIQSPTLIKTLTQILVAILGLLFLLNYLKVDIRPLLTALGVGGLAVALALQDTLSNLFAGLYLSVSNQIHVGDYVKLSTGEEGYVVDITWRSTRLRSLVNNYIFIPNSKLGQTIFTNYHLPAKDTGISINFHVSFDADTDVVEALILEEVNSGAVAGISSSSPPSVLWSPIADSFLLFTLNLDVDEFSKQFRVQSEMRKRIFKRFRKEGIPLSYPTQSVLIKPSASQPAGESTSRPTSAPAPSHFPP